MQSSQHYTIFNGNLQLLFLLSPVPAGEFPRFGGDFLPAAGQKHRRESRPAGKRNSQVVAAAIQNFSTAEKAMTEMANSQGNAMAEMEIAYESINYKVNQFKETLVGIAQSSFNQDFLKSMVDSGIRVLNVFDDLSPSLSFILEQFATLLELVTKIADFAGGIPLLIGGIGLKNIGSPKMFGLVLNLPIIICVL